MKTTTEIEFECKRMPIVLAYIKMKEHAYTQDAKISERKTVHQWLNDKGVKSEEDGKPICLLRRLAIALNVHD